MSGTRCIPRVLVTGPDLERGAIGGIQRHVEQLVRWFPEGSCGFEVHPFGSTTPVQDEPLPAKVLRTGRRAWAFSRVVGEYDATHINSTLDVRSVLRDSLFLAAAARRGTPAILQFHGGTVAGLGVLTRRLPSLVWRRLFGLPERILFLSEVQADEFERVYGVGTTTVVRNHIDAEDAGARPDRPEVHVLMLGRLTAEKGVGDFVELCRQLRDDGVRFDIAGEGPRADDIRHLAAADPRVVYHGQVSGTAKQELLERADILVLPTTRDALPYVLIEAAAARTALVAYDVGEVAAVIDDGTNGRLIPVGDTRALIRAVEALASDPDALARMRDAARDVFEARFDGVRGRELFAHQIYGEVIAG